MPRSRNQARTDPSLSTLADWLADARERIAEQVIVRAKNRSSGVETAVSIDHRLPCDLGDYAGWHIQTRGTFLPSGVLFSSWAVWKIKAAEKSHGHAIYCHDMLEPEIVSAVGYHIAQETHLPLLILALAFRNDANDDAFQRRRTLAGALVLKHHLHALAEKIGRGGYVDIDLNDPKQEDLARELGFRKAPKVRRFRPSGLHMRQHAPR